jgi:hypothetical protein
MSSDNERIRWEPASRSGCCCCHLVRVWQGIKHGQMRQQTASVAAVRRPNRLLTHAQSAAAVIPWGTTVSHHEFYSTCMSAISTRTSLGTQQPASNTKFSC